MSESQEPRSPARPPSAQRGSPRAEDAWPDARLVDACLGGNQLAWAALIERYNRAVRAALPAVENPRYIEAERIAPYSPRGTDVSVVLDLMIHDLDLLLALTGSPEVTDVRGIGAAVLSSHLDMVNARLELPGGTVASITASRIGRQRVRRVRIYQDTGYLTLDLASGHATFLRVRPSWKRGTGTRVTGRWPASASPLRRSRSHSSPNRYATSGSAPARRRIAT